MGFTWEHLKHVLFSIFAFQLLLVLSLMLLSFHNRVEGLDKAPYRVALLTAPTVSTHYTFAAIALLLITGIAATLGEYSARNKTVFVEIPSKQLIIIRSYGDKHLCKPLSSIPNRFRSQTKVLTTEKIADEVLEMRTFPKPPEFPKD